MADKTLDFSSLARFLKTLMDEQKGKSRGNLGRLAIAVHAVFVDSKFVLSDETKPFFADDGSQPSVLRYSIPDLSGPTAVVEFDAAGNSVTVSGYLSRDDGERSDAHRLCFDLSKLASPLISSLHGAIGDSEERAILDFWKEVRLKLSVPLCAGICYQNTIFLPSCFACLPKEVKFRVLEVVPAFDSDEIYCRCTKLGFLCEVEGIWRKRFEEKFGITSCWRKKFALGWLKKRIEVGEYGELLAGINVDELNEKRSNFVPARMISQWISTIQRGRSRSTAAQQPLSLH